MGQKLVDLCAEQGLQYGADVRLGEEARHARARRPRRRAAPAPDDEAGRPLPLPHADHHRRPRRLRAAQARDRGHRRLGGPRPPLRRAREGPVPRQGLRDRRRRRLRARLDARPPGHGQPPDRARPPARPLPRARVVRERGAAARGGGPRPDHHARRGARGARRRDDRVGDDREHGRQVDAARRLRRADHAARLRLAPRRDRELGARARGQAPDQDRPDLLPDEHGRACTRPATSPATRARSP